MKLHLAMCAMAVIGCKTATLKAPGADGAASSTMDTSASGDDPSTPSDGVDVTVPTFMGDAPGSTKIEAFTSVTSTLKGISGFLNVSGSINGDAVNVTFDPNDAAVDYRIYALPADSDINADGTINNAFYRCAGTREALANQHGTSNDLDNARVANTLSEGKIEGYTRLTADAILGYVYATPADGHLPVYVVGNSDLNADPTEPIMFHNRGLMQSTRQKTYVTDPAKRSDLLAKGGRDDGIAFYVPSSASDKTRPVLEKRINPQASGGADDILAFADAAEVAFRGSSAVPLFNVLAAAADGTLPLYRVHVAATAGAHDELSAGTARYQQALEEGDQPVHALRFTGITKETVLVIEALDQGCPNQGNFSIGHMDAFVDGLGAAIPAFLTIDEMRAKSSVGEVFMNGQYAASNKPKAIARTFLEASPAAAPTAMDYFAGFENAIESFKLTGQVDGDFTKYYESTNHYFETTNAPHFFWGAMFGELWFTYQDTDGDVLGKFRLTPKKTATLADDSYLWVTSEMDISSTGRRYPQIFISDRTGGYLQDQMKDGLSLLVQFRDYSPNYVELQMCDHMRWDGNNQCPILPTFRADTQPAAQVPGELFGLDRTVRIDLYMSTSRLYIYLDEKPYSCTSLPAKANDKKTYHAPAAGAVSVTWGDLLYHSSVDVTGPAGSMGDSAWHYTRANMQTVTRRHFDNLGFKSGVGAPAGWDQTRFPCVSEGM